MAGICASRHLLHHNHNHPPNWCHPQTINAARQTSHIPPIVIAPAHFHVELIGIYVVLIWLALMYKCLREDGSGLSVFLVGILTTLIFFALAACCGLPAAIKLFFVRPTMDESGLRFDGLDANSWCTWAAVDRLVTMHKPQRFSELHEGITLVHANRRLALSLWMFNEAQQREIFDRAAQYIQNRAIQEPGGPTSHSLRS